MEKLPRRTELKYDKGIRYLNFPPLITPPFLHYLYLSPPPSSQKLCRNKQIGEERETNIREMSSTSAVSMALPLTYASQKRLPSSDAFFKPLPAVRTSKGIAAASKTSGRRFELKASLKEKAVTGLTAAALTASMVIPDVAEAAVSPSLKNFLFSIVAGGVVLGAIVGAVIGVANFDPVKRT